MAEGKNFNFNPDGKKVLLSIDGGGMRGAIVVAMLAEMERELGKPIYEMIDMVGGTSTGAVISAGIALRMSAQALLETVYYDLLPNALGKRNFRFWMRFAFGGFRYLYPFESIVQALSPLAAGKRVKDLNNPIALMTAKDLRTSNTYFIVGAGPGVDAFGDWPVTGAVAASGAAPVYFPAVINRLIDGGVGVYGNPSLATATEAMEYIQGDFTDGNVIHLSFGTGYTPNHSPPEKVRNWHLIDWLSYVIGEGQEDATLQQALITRAIYGSRMDFRRYNPLLTRQNIEQVLGIETCGIDPMKLELDTIDPPAIQLMERIGRAYARRIDWQQPGVMPWQTIGGHQKPEIKPVDWTGSLFSV